MTFAVYAPRVNVHPDRTGNVKTSGANLWAILHTSEGGESDTAAEQLAAFQTRPGDRPNGSGGVYGSSYHVVFDTDRVIPCVPYDVVSYSAGGANAQGIHGCFPGKAGQTREQWLDGVSRNMIRQCAAWLADIHVEFGIPVDRKMFPGEMLAGDKGLGDHFTVTEAFGKTDHTDVGAGFPWDVLFADIAALTPGDDDMAQPSDVYIAKPPAGAPNNPPWFVVERFGGSVRYASESDAANPAIEQVTLNSEQYAYLRASVGI